MKTNEAIRHGELLLIKVSKRPAGLKETSSVLNIGSHGHPHAVVNGTFFVRKEEPNIIGYLVAREGCYLTHVEHSPKGAPLQKGAYQVRNQVEDGHEGMKVVID